MAEVNPNPFQIPDDIGSVYSEPAYRFTRKSLCGEPNIQLAQEINLKRSASETSLPSLNGIVALAGMEQFASLRHPDGASDPDLPAMEVIDEHDKLMEPGDNDSGLDTTPQASKLSGISRRAESGYHSVGTGRDSDLCSIKSLNYVEYDRQKRKEKSLCQWLRSCTHPDEDSERETTDL
jgi:kinesin family protein 26